MSREISTTTVQKKRAQRQDQPNRIKTVSYSFGRKALAAKDASHANLLTDTRAPSDVKSLSESPKSAGMKVLFWEVTQCDHLPTDDWPPAFSFLHGASENR
jgi:hypothetical protein